MVTHPSTTQARRCLTSEIRRDSVISPWCGRRQKCTKLFNTDSLIKYFEVKLKSTTPGLPKWSPTLVLPRPDDV